LKYGEILHQHGNASKVKVFQDLIFLIRDWNFSDDFDFGYKGGSEYFSSFVKPKDVSTIQWSNDI
jgi:hypothetical protein